MPQVEVHGEQPTDPKSEFDDGLMGSEVELLNIDRTGITPNVNLNRPRSGIYVERITPGSDH